MPGALDLGAARFAGALRSGALALAAVPASAGLADLPAAGLAVAPAVPPPKPAAAALAASGDIAVDTACLN